MDATVLDIVNPLGDAGVDEAALFRRVRVIQCRPHREHGDDTVGTFTSSLVPTLIPIRRRTLGGKISRLQFLLASATILVDY